MSSITKKAPTAKKKGNGSATTNSTARRTSSKAKPLTTEEVTLRAFRRTYSRLHSRKAA